MILMYIKSSKYLEVGDFSSQDAQEANTRKYQSLKKKVLNQNIPYNDSDTPKKYNIKIWSTNCIRI